VEYVSRATSNPFGMDPPCERFVPGYGDTTADFHVVGDHPGVHGGLESGVPFTGRPWSPAFLGALSRAGLLGAVDPPDRVETVDTFLSYLYMCEPPAEGGGVSDADYAALEPYVDAELRAITAHVLLPVGDRATAHVLREYTSRDPATADAATLHATELKGRGWLVVPAREPAAWTDGDADRLVEALLELRASDYEQVSDLGRFLPDERSHIVR